MNWRETILGNEIDFFNGKSIKPGQIGQYPAYGSNGIIGGSDEWKYENAIIIGRVGAYCGSVAYCPSKFWASDNTIVSKPKNSFSSVIFYYYLLHHIELNKYAGGAAQPLVTQTVLKQVSVRIPDVETQRRIASILSAYDNLIENNTRRIAILEEMARRIYEEWFVHFRFPGHEKVKMVDSELGKIPEGWEVTAIGKVCKRLQSGGTPSRSNPNYWSEGSVDWYKTKELWDGFLYDSEEKISEMAVNEKKTRIFQPGTILMAIYGSPTVGRLGITTRCSACNQAALGFEHDPLVITKWFLFHTLASLRQEFNNKSQGAAQQNISKEKVAETEFLKPVMDVMIAFDEIANPIWQMLLNLQTKNRNLRTTRDFLLPKLISGEIDVSKLPKPEDATA